MIALDTNVLVHAHRADLPRHAAAIAAIGLAAALPDGWAIPWPCLHEFVSVVTGRTFRAMRTPLAVAFVRSTLGCRIRAAARSARPQTIRWCCAG